MLVRVLEDLRKFTMVRKPLSEPKRVSVLCSLETGVRNSLRSSAKGGAEVENVVGDIYLQKSTRKVQACTIKQKF